MLRWLASSLALIYLYILIDQAMNRSLPFVRNISWLSIYYFCSFGFCVDNFINMLPRMSDPRRSVTLSHELFDDWLINKQISIGFWEVCHDLSGVREGWKKRHPIGCRNIQPEQYQCCLVLLTSWHVGVISMKWMDSPLKSVSILSIKQMPSLE